MARESRTTEVDPYAGLRTRAHWKPADAARVLGDWSRSGEGLSAFARRHKLGLQRLKRWRGRLGAQVTEHEGGGARLVPVVVRSKAPLVGLKPAARTFAVSLEVDTVRIEVVNAHETDPRWVAALVRELRGERT
jgi:hypothetical protein